MNAEMFGFNDRTSTFDFENPSNLFNPWDSDLLGDRGMMPPLAVRSRQLQSQSEVDLPIAEAKEAILLNATAKIGINDFNLRTEGRVTFNGGGDLDGEPLNLSDDTHIYARRGFTFNNTPILPIDREFAHG